MTRNFFAFLALCFGVSRSQTDSTLKLLEQASENQYRGSYAADVVFVRESFLHGVDSLRGRLNFDDLSGDRQMRLRGRDDAFDWWSRNFGQEQWWADANSKRQHRIPLRSLKKPAFASLLTYEDLMKLPADYLLEFESCEKLPDTDSTYEMRLKLKPQSVSRYGSLDVSLRRKPVLLRRVVFFSPGGNRLKSLEITTYRQTGGGAYLPVEFHVFDSDSLSSARLSLGEFQATSSTKDLDNTRVPVRGLPRQMTLEASPREIVPDGGSEDPNAN
jgi:hypothetical protein